MRNHPPMLVGQPSGHHPNSLPTSTQIIDALQRLLCLYLCYWAFTQAHTVWLGFSLLAASQGEKLTTLAP